VESQEVQALEPVIADLHDTLLDFREKHGAGRAIAAPQIGVMKRLIYVHIDQPLVIFNPVIEPKGSEMIEVWDDCMCFPELLIKVLRHRECRLVYRDLRWLEKQRDLQGDTSELLQHEYDHLDGILATSRAIDERAFALRSQRRFLS
jgi:peptide deformylase